MSEADSITPVAAAGDERVQRRLGGGGAGGRDLRRVAAGVAQPVVQRAGLQHLALGRAGALAEQRVDLRQRLLDLLARGRPVDQRGHLDQLQEARHGAVHVGGGVQAHLAQLPAHLGHRVQQLVAHDPERGVQALGGAEQLLLHRAPRRPTARRARPPAGSAGRASPASDQDSTRLSRAREAARATSGRRARGRRGARRGAWPARRARRRPARAVGQRAGGQAGHEHVVELAPARGVDVQHLHRALVLGGRHLLPLQAGVGHGPQVAGEVARAWRPARGA